MGKLKKPRRVMMLVKAGSAVDAFIDKLVPLLEEGDIIIDGGNSEYTDSQVREGAWLEGREGGSCVRQGTKLQVHTAALCVVLCPPAVNKGLDVAYS